MDPLSVTAAIVGLLGAAAQISSSLSSFIEIARGASTLAQNILGEVQEIRACLTQVQLLVSETNRELRPRAALILIDHVAVTLTTSVLEFSKLEKIVDSLGKINKKRTALCSYRWAMKEQSIKAILSRLQVSRTSLNLMLTTWTCISLEEAQSSTRRLSAQIQQVLEGNQELQVRLASTIAPSMAPSIKPSSLNDKKDHNDDSSTIIPAVMESQSAGTEDSAQHSRFGFTFDEDLHASRVYKRAKMNSIRNSMTSSAYHSVGWSFLSGLSLGEISNVAVMSLPISREELWNRERYSNRPEKRLLLLGDWEDGKRTILKKIQDPIAWSFDWSSFKDVRNLVHSSLRQILLDVAIETEVLRRLIEPRLEREQAPWDPSSVSWIFSQQEVLRFSPYLRAIPHNSEDLPQSLETFETIQFQDSIPRRDGWKMPPSMHNLNRLLMAGAFVCNLSPMCLYIQMPEIVIVDGYPTRDFKILESEIDKSWKLHKAENYVILVAALPERYHQETWQQNPLRFNVKEFEEIVNLKGFQATPIFIFFTKIERFAQSLPHVLSSNTQPSSGKLEEWLQTAEMYSELIRNMDRRLNGQLHIYYADHLNDRSFRDSSRELRTPAASRTLDELASLNREDLAKMLEMTTEQQFW